MNETQLRAAVLNELPKQPYLDAELRLKYVGLQTTLEKIKAAKFSKEGERNNRLIFSRYFHENRLKLILDFSIEMILQRIRVSEISGGYEDTINDCMVYKWSYIEAGNWLDEQKEIETHLHKIFDVPKHPSALVEKGVAMLSDYSSRRTFDKSNLNSVSFEMCCQGFDYWDDGDNCAASHFVIELMRHIKEIQHPSVLSDLPFLAGRLGLCGECVTALKEMLTRNLELSAGEWSNIGAVLCDAIWCQAAAIECFKYAIDKEPRLLPPQQAIWIATNRLMGQVLSRRDYAKVLEIGAETEKMSKFELSHHGVWSYLGIAAEMLNDKEKAQKYYVAALKRDSNCLVAKQGMQRTTGEEKDYTQKLNIEIKRIIDSQVSLHRRSENVNN